MTNRPAGLSAARPWAGTTPKPGETHPQRPLNPLRDADPCQGCRHLFVRYADGGPGRPECAQGVDYGQTGCSRRHGH